MSNPVATAGVDATMAERSAASRAQRRRRRRERRLLLVAGAVALAGMVVAAILVLEHGSPGHATGTSGTIGLSMASTAR